VLEISCRRGQPHHYTIVIASEANAERGNLFSQQPQEIASADEVNLAMTEGRIIASPDLSGRGNPLTQRGIASSLRS
jgi:hypothetical protein